MENNIEKIFLIMKNINKQHHIFQLGELEEEEKNLPVKNKEEISDNDISPERKELTPTNFDTSQPFTDDSDEVEFDVADYEYDEELKRGASRYHDDEVLKVSDEDDSTTN